MIHRFIAALTASLLALGTGAAADKEADTAKAALKEGASEFIGMWKGEGKGPKRTFWKEEADWSWKFKDGNAWVAFKVDGNDNLAAGDLRYLPEDKEYELTTTDTDGNKLVYTGKFNARRELELEATDAKTKDLHRMKLYTLANGARMIIKDEVKKGGRGLYLKAFESAVTKEGESFAGGAGTKKECVVTGGLGTIAVSFGGKTFYVCCSGCRDEFNADPAKYVAEFEAKQK